MLHSLGKILHGSHKMLCHHHDFGYPDNWCSSSMHMCKEAVQLISSFPPAYKAAVAHGETGKIQIQRWGCEEATSNTTGIVFTEREKQKLQPKKAARCRSCRERLSAQDSPAAGCLGDCSWHWDVFNHPSPDQTAGLQTAGHLVSSQLTISWRTARKKLWHWTAASWIQCFEVNTTACNFKIHLETRYKAS